MKKVIVLNGPPMVGKDTLANKLKEAFGYDIKTFKEALIEKALEVAPMIDREDYSNRETKDFVHPALSVSPRQLLINLSEGFIKPTFGSNYFGKQLFNRLKAPITVVPDGGFDDEIMCLVQGGIEVLIIQMFRSGCSFKNDSRGYFQVGDLVVTKQLGSPYSNMTEQEYFDKAVEIINYWLQYKK